MEPSPQSLKLYTLFKKIFIADPAPMNKYWGNIGNDLHVEFKLKAENRNIMLQNIEKEMNAGWKKAFDSLLSVKSKIRKT